MAKVRLCWLPGRSAPTVVSNGFGPLPLLRAGVRELTETSLTYQALDLIFEVNTLLSIRTVVLVKTVIFGLVSPIGRRP